MLRVGIITGVTSSNLDDSIRALCAEAIAVRDPVETEVVLADLKTAIEEYAMCIACKHDLKSVQPRLDYSHPPRVI